MSMLPCGIRRVAGVISGRIRALRLSILKKSTLLYISIAVITCLLVTGCFLKKSKKKEGPEVVWRVKTHHKIVALTLDDGPDPKYTPQVLNILKQENIHCTFFLIGEKIQKYPDLAKEEVLNGNLIGNHTWDHPDLLKDTSGQDISEIERCEQEIEKICGERTYLFRPPKGMWDGDTFLAAHEIGYRMILWTVTVEHHSAKTPEAMAQRIINKVRPGMIILAHDGEPHHALNREKTMKALPLIIEGLKQKGYQFVTVEELLKKGKTTS